MVHTIRPADAADEQGLVACTLDNGDVMNRANVGKWVRNCLRHDIVKVVVDQAGQINGYIAFRVNSAAGPQPAHVYIRRFFVRPDQQGQGLGGMLLREVYSRARREGLPMKVHAVSADSKAVFEGQGFTHHTFTDTSGAEHERWLQSPPPISRSSSHGRGARSEDTGASSSNRRGPSHKHAGSQRGDKKKKKKKRDCCIM